MKIAAVVLAAGQGRRFGGDKLLAHLRGRAVIDHVLDALTAFTFETVVCVVRPENHLSDHLKEREVIPIVNADSELGMGTSIAAGIRALPPVDAAFIILGDMPAIPAELFERMTAAKKESSADIVVPRHDGQQGHPVLFDRACFRDLMALNSDIGARTLIRSGTYTVVQIATDNAGILRDTDVPGDFDAFR